MDRLVDFIDWSVVAEVVVVRARRVFGFLSRPLFFAALFPDQCTGGRAGKWRFFIEPRRVGASSGGKQRGVWFFFSPSMR